MLDINITAVIQVVNFFIAVIVLNYLLIRPVREMLKQRRAKMDDLLASAEAFNSSAAEQISSYQAALGCARQEAAALRATARADALAGQQALLGEEGRLAQEKLTQEKLAVQKEKDDARAALAKQVKPLAAKAAARVLAA